MAQIIVSPDPDEVERARLRAEQQRLADEARSRWWRPWKRVAAVFVGAATVVSSTVAVMSRIDPPEPTVVVRTVPAPLPPSCQ